MMLALEHLLSLIKSKYRNRAMTDSPSTTHDANTFRSKHDYQSLSKQMRSEVTVKTAAVLPKSSSPNETQVDKNSSSLTTEVKPERKEPRKLSATPIITKPSKSPRRIGAMPALSPEEMALPIMMCSVLSQTFALGDRISTSTCGRFDKSRLM